MGATPDSSVTPVMPFDAEVFLGAVGAGRKIEQYETGSVIYSQGDAAASVYYILDGKIKLTVLSPSGKEAVIAILGQGDFFGEGCLNGQALRMATAVVQEYASLATVQKAVMTSTLQAEATFSARFIEHLLKRNIRIEEDLIDQLFNSSEKRLARILLLLANFGKEGAPSEVICNVSQETLAEMIGTTRSRVSFFLNKFRKLGFIEYNGSMHVHSSLLNVILHD
ncbi:MAG: Crp/Fnr family transcriptional regulator [Candidatus Baltobacteraceae bacterium]